MLPKLKPSQYVAVEYARNRKHVLIRDETGVGKTPEFFAICDDKDFKQILVITRAKLIIKWENEERLWQRYTHNREFRYVSFEGLARFIEEQYPDWKPDCIGIDEIHFAKNAEAKRTRLTLGLAKDCPNTVGLSATFPPNNPAELWPYVSTFLPPEERKGITREKAWIDYWCDWYEHKPTPWSQPVKCITGCKKSRRKEFSEYLDSISLRRTLDEVHDDIEPAELRLVLVDPSDFEERMITNEERDVRSSVIARYNRGKRIPMAEQAAIRHKLCVTKAPHVIKHVKKLLRTEHKVIIVAYHHIMMEKCLTALSGYGTAVMNGAQNNRKNEAQRRKFMTEANCRVLVIQISLAVGHNITSANRIVFAEASWTPSDNEQAIGRIRRYGQMKRPIADFVVIRDTIDAHILETALRKQESMEYTESEPKEEEIWA